MSRTMFAAMAMLCVLVVPRAATAQGSVTGRVVDESGAPLPGASVVLSFAGAQNPREALSDRTGSFAFANVPEGAAQVHVEMSGFRAVDVRVTVATGPAPAITATLKIGFEEEVVVSGDATGGVLSPSRNANAVEFDPEALRRLPTSSQDLQSLVEAFSTTAGGDAVSVVVDGMQTDSSAVPAAAIHRLNINRNPYSVEFKAPGGSRVEIETERGSRRYYHGSGAFFLRDSALQSRNAFAASTPPLRRALNEGTFGGRLPAKGWSFFMAGQQLFDNAAAIVHARTPSGALQQNVSAPERRTTLATRVDFRPNKVDAVTLKYELFDDLERNHGVGGFRLPDQAYTTTERRHRLQATDHRVVLGDVVNDLRIEGAFANRADGAPAQGVAIVVPGALVSGASQTFTSADSRTVQVQDITSLTLAAHPVRFGARVKSRWMDALDASNFGGTFQFQSLADLAAGRPQAFIRRTGDPGASFVDTDASVFAEATFRPRATMSITTGLRYDWQAHVADWNNLSPRLAAAFAPEGRKTVFRAGLGLFYESLSDEAIARALLFGDAGLREELLTAPSFPAVPALAAPGLRPSSTWRLAAGLTAPAIVQASVAADHALWRKSSISLEYLVARTSGALRARDVNAPIAGSAVRPDPSRLGVFQIESSGSRRTDALSATFRGRLAGFRGTIQYTLAHATDDTAGAFDLPADSDDLAAEQGRADFDRRHRFNLAGSYGWRHDRLRIGAVLAAWSGAPFDIVSGADSNRDAVFNDRPAGVTRNTGQGPGFAQLDLRFTSVFRAPRPPSKDPESAKREQTDNFELTIDLFNALNRVNATAFVGVLTSPLFGQANAARTPRAAQLSVRYRF